MKFTKYNFADEIIENITQLGFVRPTDIQFKSIPSIMQGEDVLAIAQTGTGKTAAFAIPIINKIHNKKISKRSKGIQCLVIVPTHELAQQIGEVFKHLSKHTKVKTYALYGGVEMNPQIKKLQAGLDILISTPGRMFELIREDFISLNYIHTFVIDEADHMLDKGFIKDIKFIKSMLQKRHQTLFFSATINRDIKKLAFTLVKSTAIRIQISPKDPVSKNVSHFVIHVEKEHKRFFLEKFIIDNSESKILVFVRTRVRAERVQKAMERFEINTLSIHGGKEQDERTEVLKHFKSNDSQILIATDVSARGIDIENINYVINYDLPEVAENYVHRVGRTGRGMKKGTAISFCDKSELPLLEEIQNMLPKEIEEIKISRKDRAQIINGFDDTIPLKHEVDLQDLISPYVKTKKNKSKDKNKKKNKKDSNTNYKSKPKKSSKVSRSKRKKK